MEMKPERKSAQDADSLSGLEKLRTQRSAFLHSHRPGGHPQELTNPRGGPNQMIKSGPDRVDKPSAALFCEMTVTTTENRAAQSEIVSICCKLRYFCLPSNA